jgi:SAM-dependent methyltransferase
LGALIAQRDQRQDVHDIDMICPCDERRKIAGTAVGKYYCSDSRCTYGNPEAGGFICARGIPVLIAFDKVDTVCTREAYTRLETPRAVNSVLVNDSTYMRRIGGPVIDFLRWVLWGSNAVTRSNCDAFIEALGRPAGGNRKILIVGSGSRGHGTERLYEERSIDVTGIDIRPSDTVDFICDAHFLPFADASFDGVWIQAVLEHVESPLRVVAEIHRILKSNGIVYAETPFMQQVHEGGYDFSRFTEIGHRNLLRELETLGTGVVAGPGVALAWSIKYFFVALFRSRLIGTAVALPFQFIFRLADHLIPDCEKSDGASGVWFLGRKNEAKRRETAQEVVSHYAGRF